MDPAYAGLPSKVRLSPVGFTAAVGPQKYWCRFYGVYFPIGLNRENVLQVNFSMGIRCENLNSLPSVVLHSTVDFSMAKAKKNPQQIHLKIPQNIS